MEPAFRRVALIGKVGSTDVAILSALDGKQYAKGGGGDPAFNIARIRRDLGSQSTIGMLLANAPVAFFGDAIAKRLPVPIIHRIAAGVFALLVRFGRS